MKHRCENPDSQVFKYYGARGIKVCDRWLHSFENFLKDMGKRPKGFQLDRINNNGDYEPSNCRWASRTINIRNGRSTKLSMIDANEIRFLYDSGDYTYRHLGFLYGVTKEMIGCIIRNKNWIIA